MVQSAQPVDASCYVFPDKTNQPLALPTDTHCRNRAAYIYGGPIIILTVQWTVQRWNDLRVNGPACNRQRRIEWSKNAQNCIHIVFGFGNLDGNSFSLILLKRSDFFSTILIYFCCCALQSGFGSVLCCHTIF